MKVHYIEIVTPDVEGACSLHMRLHSITFSDPVPSLGGARTARTENGELLGIRAPLQDAERPVTRTYNLVQDIEAAVSKAMEEGAVIAVPPMSIPGYGKCAILFCGGVEMGLWQT